MSNSTDNPDDELMFSDEPGSADEQQEDQPVWVVMIVDDDPFIHEMTKLVLEDAEIQGRRLELLSALSGTAARDLMVERPDTAVILLDMIMETEDAGLRTAQHIRTEMDNRTVYIMLRTGQPGVLSEITDAEKSWFDSVRSKTELTAIKLKDALAEGIAKYAATQT